MNNARFLKMINDNPITPIEMESYLQALEKQDDQSFETQTFVGCDIFPDNKGKRFSISMRLHALARILESEDLPGWVKPTDEDGIIRVAENIYGGRP